MRGGGLRLRVLRDGREVRNRESSKEGYIEIK